MSFVFVCWHTTNSTNKHQKYKSIELGDQLCEYAIHQEVGLYHQLSRSEEIQVHDATHNQKCLYSVNTLLSAPAHCITEYHWSVS